MVNRKWAYRELFDSEEEAARAYDDAVWRLKPKEAKSYINFKERFNGGRAGRLHRPRELFLPQVPKTPSSSRRDIASCHQPTSLPRGKLQIRTSAARWARDYQETEVMDAMQDHSQ